MILTSVGLVYLNNSKTIHLGLAYISAVLKQHNHKVVLFDSAFTPVNEIVEKIKDSDIQVAMFSVHSIVYKQAVHLSSQLKQVKPGIKILFGGWHILIDPEDVIRNDSVDMICIGEGEYAALDVADNINDPDKLTVTPNVWFKKNNEIIKNPVRVLGDINSLPFPDRDIFHRECLSDPSGLFHFLTMRGCPYSCSFCCNYKIIDLYKKTGCSYIRFRDIDKCIDEMKLLKTRYNPKEFFFTDEMFLTKQKRVWDFCKKYKESDIGIPFGFMARVEHITDSILKVLKDAGCRRIHFGVESGNETLRTTFLNRHMSNQDIIDAFNLCHKHGIYTASFNMIGLPFETKKTIDDTLKLNKCIKPNIFQVTILYPFVGTKIREVYKKQGLLDKNRENNIKENNYYDSCITHSPFVSFSYIKHMQIFMNLYFNHSKFFAKLSFLIPTLLLNKYNHGIILLKKRLHI